MRDASLRADILGPGAAALAPVDGAMAPLTIHGTAHAAANARLLSDTVLGVKLDTAGNVADAHRDTRAAAITDATVVPLKQANIALENQLAMLGAQRDMFGRSQAAIEGATRAQGLWNTLVSNSAAPAGALAHQTGALADQVRLYGGEVEKAARQQEDFDRMRKGIVEASDLARGGLSNILSGGVLSAAHGQGFGTGAKSALASFGESLLTKGVSGGINMLTGGAGTPFGGGLFGSLVSSLEHHALGGTAPGGPFIAGENGPEIVMDAPKGAQIMTADQTGGLLAGRGGGGHTFNIGGPTINVDGDVSKRNLAEIRRAAAAAQQGAIDHVTRNLPQIQSDARQY